MSYNQVILLLGTNLGDKNLNLKTAEKLISSEVGEIIKKSIIIETEPEGFDSDNNFLNQTITVKTTFSPVQLLKSLKSIELKMGRTYLEPVETKRYQDRTIDIDILCFNALIFESKILYLPHHQVYTRNFIKLLL